MDDLISRQAAIDGILQFMPAKPREDATIEEQINYVAWCCALGCAESFVRTMPPAQPEVYWSERCKDCKWNCFSGCSIVYNNELDKPNLAPEIDSAPVVRCKDCVHSYEAYGDLHCERYCHYSTPNDFCSRGERRDDAEIH